MKQIVSLLSFLFLLTNAVAVEIAGQRFDQSCVVGTNSLQLHGTALLKVKLVFKVYAAGLYLADGRDAGCVLSNVPKRIEIAYLRDVPRSIIIDAAEDHFRDNFQPGQIAALRERLDAINELYQDVKEGDRYALTYIPGGGSELALNDRVLGRIPGDDFASAYFGIWLGPGCAAPEVRRGLLKIPDESK